MVMLASLHLHTYLSSTHGFVCSLIMLAGEQSGCYLNWRFINRPVFCCSRHRKLTHSLTCTKKRSGDTHAHTSCCQIHWSILSSMSAFLPSLLIRDFVFLFLVLFLHPFHSLPYTACTFSVFLGLL